jgi:hypothetical protein
MRSGLSRQKKGKKATYIEFKPLTTIDNSNITKVLSRRPRKKASIRRPDFIERAEGHLQVHLSNICTQFLQPLRITCLPSLSSLLSLFHQIIHFNTLSYLDLTKLIIEIEDIHLRDRYLSYHASIAMDVCIGKWVDCTNARTWGISDETAQRITCYKSEGSMICCAHTLPDYFQAIHSFASIDPVSSHPLTPLARMLSKVIAPMKCRGRKFQSVFFNVITTTPSVKQATDEMLLCSLLGNYPHCEPSVRPGIAARILIHAIMGLTESTPLSADVMNSSVGYREEWYSHLHRVSTAFRTNMYKLTWRIMVFVYREYGIWIIDSSPALRDSMEKQFNYTLFRETVIKIMDRFRLFIHTALRDRSRHGFTDDDILSDHELDTDGKPILKPYEQELESIVKSAHPRILKTTFRRKQPGFMCDMIAYRAKLPPTVTWAPEGKPIFMRLPNLETPTWEYKPVQPHTKIDRQTLSKLLTSDIITRSEPSFTLHVTDDEDDLSSLHRSPSSSSKRPPGCVLVSFHMISIEHTHTLTDLIQRFPSTTPQRAVILTLLSVLPAFGSPTAACDLVWKIIKGHDSGKVNKTNRTDLIKELRTTYPYTYNIITATSVIWEWHSRIKRYPLPFHYWKNQLEAITARCKLSTHMDIPEPIPVSVAHEHIDLSICSVCQDVYSLVRAFSIVPKRPYYAAYKGKYVDTIENKCYCSQSNITWNSSCQTTELSSVMLLGHIIIIKKKTYMICPQRACGMPMLYEPAHCAWSDRGPACSKCTETLDKATEQKIKTENDDYLNPSRGCMICKGDKRISKSTDTFLYGPGTYICRRHHNQRLADYVNSQLPKAIDESPIHTPVNALIRSLVLSHRHDWAVSEGIRGKQRDKYKRRQHRNTEMTRLGRYM